MAGSRSRETLPHKNVLVFTVMFDMLFSGYFSLISFFTSKAGQDKYCLEQSVLYILH